MIQESIIKASSELVATSQMNTLDTGFEGWSSYPLMLDAVDISAILTVIDGEIMIYSKILSESLIGWLKITPWAKALFVDIPMQISSLQMMETINVDTAADFLNKYSSCYGHATDDAFKKLFDDTAIKESAIKFFKDGVFDNSSFVSCKRMIGNHLSHYLTILDKDCETFAKELGEGIDGDAGLLDIAVTKTPRRHNKDVVLNLIKKVGDHTLLKRLQLVDKAVDMAIVFAKLKKAWDDDISSEARRLSRGTIGMVRPLRIAFHEMQAYQDGERVKDLFTDREKRYELFWPAYPKMLEMVLFIFRKSWWMLEEIYRTWRDDLDTVDAEIMKNDVAWKEKEDELLNEPLRSMLLTNPGYGQLASSAKTCNGILAAIPELHSDSIGVIFDPFRITLVKRHMDDAVDTVSVTYTFFHVAVQIVQRTAGSDQVEAAKNLKKQLAEKNYTVPKILMDKLDSFIVAGG